MADSFLYNRDDMRIHAMVLAWLACAPLHGQGPVRLQVDATDAPRRLFHVRMNIPAKPGPMTLLYPEWIPGEHGPTGPVVNLVGLKIAAGGAPRSGGRHGRGMNAVFRGGPTRATGPVVNLVGLKIAAGGQPVPWRRDDVNMYAFHVEVPAGASALDVAFDFISPPDAAGFSSGSSATSRLAVIGWNQFALYPEGAQPDDLQYQASLRLPDSWRFGTALPARPRSGGEIEFETVSLTTLIDSPLSAGA